MGVGLERANQQSVKYSP